MPDPQLAALAKHCRRMAEKDRQVLAGRRGRRTGKTTLTKRIALWLQLADEIDAYLAGQLDDHTPPDDHPALFVEGGD